ncbi:MAG: LysR family transcriptional regulator [Deltaproteobacteria bacterium]|nr:LysR family transcriptional regulator [Deltaproteobacteria bacterium]MBI3294374.1 LysR family transcriptional regulator [Deltaproteobacteria bacterium]
MKIQTLGGWEAFEAVAQHGGFTAAARHLRLPLSQVSKRVAQLESDLGAKLFQRSTRVVALTDEGRTLRPKIQSILSDLKEAESIFETQQPLSGTIRLTTVPFVAHQLLLPIFTEFQRLHPAVRFEIDLSEARINLIEEGFDMAVRIETPRDTTLIYRKLAPNDLVFCVSPT